MNKIYLIVFFVCLLSPCYTQEKRQAELLDSVARTTIPQLETKLNFSVSDLPLKEFIRAFSHDAGINVVIPSNLDNTITNNFINVRAADILAFICEENELDISLNGNIIKLTRHESPLPLPEPLDIHYNKLLGRISFDLKGEILSEVIKMITTQTGFNIIAAPPVSEKKVNSFVQSLPVVEALKLMCKAASLRLEPLGDSVFMVNSLVETSQDDNAVMVKRVERVQVDTVKGITVQVKGARLDELFCYVMQQARQKYRLLSKMEDIVDMDISNSSVEDFLYQMFKGGKYTWLCQDGVYYAGERDKPELKTCKMINLHYRSVVGLTGMLPRPLFEKLEVKEFDQLNGLLIFGDSDRVLDFARFVETIDRTVPVILIDIIIVDISDKVSLDIGLEFGLGGDGSPRKGGVSSGIDAQINGDGFNKLIKKVGLVNLGKVPTDFYMKLKALEDDGYVNIRSTPRLSTINGNEAKMSIGKTEYYKEERQDYFGTQDPQLSKQITYKEVQAELSVIIRPVVAGNESVSLNVKVEQSDFTERISDEGPPGKTSRKFESIIQVMDRETILLGGLEEELNKRSTKGVPFLSRVPVIKWLFGSNQKSREKNRLNILIKPVIIR